MLPRIWMYFWFIKKPSFCSADLFRVWCLQGISHLVSLLANIGRFAVSSLVLANFQLSVADRVTKSDGRRRQVVYLQQLKLRGESRTFDCLQLTRGRRNWCSLTQWSRCEQSTVTRVETLTRGWLNSPGCFHWLHDVYWITVCCSIDRLIDKHVNTAASYNVCSRSTTCTCVVAMCVQFSFVQ